jgi:hypothetical protein
MRWGKRGRGRQKERREPNSGFFNEILSKLRERESKCI